MLMTNKKSAYFKGATLHSKIFFYNIYATNWIFIFLAPKLSFRKKHPGKTKKDFLVYEFANFVFSWQRKNTEKITPNLRDDPLVKKNPLK